MLRATDTSSRTRAHLRNNLVGYVALFLALTMGTAFATHPGGANTISTDDIIDGEVRQADIQNGAVTTADISNSNGVRSEDVLDDTDPAGGLAAVDLAPASVASSELAPAAVGSGALQDFSVSNGKLLTSAVTSSKIATAAVTQSDIATNGVAGAEIVDNGVRGADINADAVGARALRPIITRSINVTIAAGSQLPAGGTVDCSSDEVVIGGGSDWTPALHHTNIIEEHRSGNGWRVLGYYGDGPQLSENPPSVSLRIEAYCLPL